MSIPASLYSSTCANTDVIKRHSKQIVSSAADAIVYEERRPAVGAAIPRIQSSPKSSGAVRYREVGQCSGFENRSGPPRIRTPTTPFIRALQSAPMEGGALAVKLTARS